MTADFRLIMYTAQAHAGKFPPHTFGNRMGDAGFAHTRRAHQADDLPFYIGVQLAHGQQFQDAFLDLLQTVVFPVQYLTGMGLVQIIFGGYMPGQRQAGVQIAADHTTFGRISLHTGKAVTFFQKFLGGFGIQLQCLDLLAVLFCLCTGIFRVPQFLTDDVHLLPQVIFPLALIHLGIDLVIQVTFNLQHLAFLAQQGQQFFQASQQGGLVEDSLLVLVFQKQVGRHVFTQE